MKNRKKIYFYCIYYRLKQKINIWKLIKNHSSNILRKKCIYCGTPFTKVNNSDEHPISEGIGGKLSRKFLLCKECNKTLSKFDAALQQHLALFLNLKKIKGKRNKEVSVKAESNLGKVIFKDGTPIVLPTVIDNTNGSKTILGDKKYTDEIFKGFKKKYPNLRVKARKDETLSLITLKLIEQNVWKGIGKILFLFAHHFNENYIPKTDFFKNFLSQPEENDPFICPLGWASKVIDMSIILPEKINKNLSDCYIVIIDYRNKEKCIIGYIQFFNIGYIGIIDDNYEGDSKVLGYYINIRNKESQEFSCPNKLNINRKDLTELFDNWLSKASLDLFREQYSKAFQDAKLSKDIEDTFFSVAEEVGLKEGDLLNKKFLTKFVGKFMNSDSVKNLLPNRQKSKKNT